MVKKIIYIDIYIFVYSRDAIMVRLLNRENSEGRLYTYMMQFIPNMEVVWGRVLQD